MPECSNTQCRYQAEPGFKQCKKCRASKQKWADEQKKKAAAAGKRMCRGCKHIFPLTAFTGDLSTCKECLLDTAASDKAKREEIDAQNLILKESGQHKCTRCKAILPSVEFAQKVLCPSCRQYKKEWYEKHKNDPKFKFKQYIKSAKERGIKFLVSFKKACEFFHKKACHYCGVERKASELLGIDRVNNDLRVYPANGENLVACCRACNVIKGGKKVQEFSLVCQEIGETCSNSYEELRDSFQKTLANML